MTKLTDAVFKADVRDEAKVQSFEELNRFFDAVKINLDLFSEFFNLCDAAADNCFNKLVSIENDLTLFTYKRYDLKQYKPNMMGECVIRNIGSCANGRCYINDLEK